MLAQGLTRSSRTSRFGFASLLLLTLLPFGCRVRYEELQALGVAGASASQGVGGMGAAAVGGADTSRAGSNGAAAGIDNAAGATDTAGAASSGGADGSSGNGTGGSSATCESTADCACDALDGHDYWFCAQHLYWGDAEAHCESAGMLLVRIDSQAENDWLGATGTAHGVFEFNDFAQIGASDSAVAGEWRWPDGTLFWQGAANGNVVGSGYASWDASSPSASGVQRCSGTLGSGLWQDRSCTGAQPFICERY
jgi:hypothetical protein